MHRPSGRPPLRPGFLGGLVVVWTMLAFLPVVKNDFVNWDDPRMFLENPYHRQPWPARLRYAWSSHLLGEFMPMTWMSYSLDRSLWDLHAPGYHLTSLLLHVLAALAVFALARRLLRHALRTGGPSRAAIDVGAVVAALVFAVHPLRVEPVAWVSARGTVLGGLRLEDGRHRDAEPDVPDADEGRPDAVRRPAERGHRGGDHRGAGRDASPMAGRPGRLDRLPDAARTDVRDRAVRAAPRGRRPLHLRGMPRMGLVVGGAVALGWQAWKDGRASHLRSVLVASALLVVLLGWSLASWRQAAVWRDGVALWTRAVAVVPQSQVARSNLGTALAARRDFSGAAAQYREAAREWASQPGAFLNLGRALAADGRFAEAVEPFRRLVELRPGWAEAHLDLGTVLYNLGEVDGAVAEFSRAVELAPGSVRAHESLGTALWRQGRETEAAKHLQRGAALGSGPPAGADLAVPRPGAAGADGS